MSDEAVPIEIGGETKETGPEKVGAGILFTWVSQRQELRIVLLMLESELVDEIYWCATFIPDLSRPAGMTGKLCCYGGPRPAEIRERLAFPEGIKMLKMKT